MLVELLLQINSNYSLNKILECALWQRFLQEIDSTNFYELQLHYAMTIFLEFGEVTVEYFVYKKVFGIPPLCLLLLPFFEAFSIPVKNENTHKK